MANLTRYLTTTRRRPIGQGDNQLSIIILAGSIGYKMKSYGPKSLLVTKSGENLLEHQVGVLETCFPNSEIVLVTGFEADKVIKRKPKHIRAVENQLYETTGELEQVRIGLNNCINDSVLIITGDLYFNSQCVQDITEGCSSILVDNGDFMTEDEMGVTVVDEKATIFSYSLEKKWCNIVYLTGKEFKNFRYICNNRERGRLYVFEALNEVLNKKGVLRAFQPKNMGIIRVNGSQDIKKLLGE